LTVHLAAKGPSSGGLRSSRHDAIGSDGSDTGLGHFRQPPDSDLGMIRHNLELDLHYPDHRTLWFDLRITLAGALHMLKVPRGDDCPVLRIPIISD